MNQLLSLLTLKDLKGGRTQLVILIMGLLNVLVNLQIINMSPEDLKQVEQFLLWAGAYFFAEKLSGGSK